MEMLEQKEGRLIVHLPGELDHHHTENIRAAVDHMIRTTLIGEVEFDFSETLFMSINTPILHIQNIPASDYQNSFNSLDCPAISPTVKVPPSNTVSYIFCTKIITLTPLQTGSCQSGNSTNTASSISK